jgi:hypothetical protein
MGKRPGDPGRERVRAWVVSGVSILAFCGRHQLIETTFRHWRRELRDRDAVSSARSVAAPASPRFVPVTVLPAGPVACCDDPGRSPFPVGACRDGADGWRGRSATPIRGLDRVGVE